MPPGPREPRLCGFLQKQAGPLRAWKQRWFTYEDKKNQLFYYRTPQDVMPLGQVDLSSATFTYPLKAESGTFHIKTPERTFILKVRGRGQVERINGHLSALYLQLTCCPAPSGCHPGADALLAAAAAGQEMAAQTDVSRQQQLR